MKLSNICERIGKRKFKKGDVIKFRKKRGKCTTQWGKISDCDLTHYFVSIEDTIFFVPHEDVLGFEDDRGKWLLISD